MKIKVIAVTELNEEINEFGSKWEKVPWNKAVWADGFASIIRALFFCFYFSLFFFSVSIEEMLYELLKHGEEIYLDSW